MRRILVEQARRKQADKRGGQADRQDLHESQIAAPEPDEDLLAIHGALDLLAVADPVAADVVRLRFFAGVTMQEVADILGMSVRSAHDVWAYARSWLHRKIQPG
jgi:RNA polymerase sigma factor (TIGR02999 family)